LGAIDNAAQYGKHTGTTFALNLPVGQQWFEVSIARRASGDTREENGHFVAIARNVTERKQAEVLEIEREKLKIALEKEKDLTQLREQLISMISHELRTPLSVISVTSSVLEKHMDQLTPVQQADRLRTIMTQVKHLDEMLDQVSMLSKAHRGFLQYKPQQVEISRLCEQIIKEMQPPLSLGQQLELEIEPSIGLVSVDQRLLWHVLVNLISNAIKYSPNGGLISLKVNHSNKFVVIQVQDEGLGIPESELGNIFEPFYRADNVESIGGTGLGLSIVKEIIDLHHGSVACASREGYGTTFTIRIPIIEAA
jgi:hypothetical protein